MKILYHIKYPQGMGADRFIYEGYKHAWEDKGHDFFIFSENEDLSEKLEKIKPDLFFTSLDQLKIPEDINVIKKFSAQGVKMFVGVDHLFNKNLETLSVLRDRDFADVYFGEKELECMIGFKEKIGKEYNLIPHAADKYYHYPVEPVKKYQYDIVFLGARLPQKEWFFTNVLIPLTKKYKVGIFGPYWSLKDNALRVVNSMFRKIGFKKGADFLNKFRITVPLEEENQLYSSAKICLNFHEREKDGSQPNYILNQRTFKIPACGGFEICDYIPALRRYFTEDEVVMAGLDSKDWFGKIEYYLNNENERLRIKKNGAKRVLKDHTYHNRVDYIIELFANA